jgi:hypothetical protein
MSKEQSYSPVPTVAMNNKEEDFEVGIVKPAEGRDSKQPR